MDDGTPPGSLSREELRSIVLAALAGDEPTGGRETFHARFDHPERGISIDDVVFGLEQEWKSCRAERFDSKEWQWRYRIETETIDGDPLVLIVAVDSASKSFMVVTRWKT